MPQTLSNQPSEKHMPGASLTSRNRVDAHWHVVQAGGAGNLCPQGLHAARRELCHNFLTSFLSGFASRSRELLEHSREERQKVQQATDRISVLLVEDDPMLAIVLEESLELLGHAVSEKSARLVDALTAVVRDSFDIAMIDVRVAGADSYPVADILIQRRIPFLFMTGFQSSALPERFAGIPVIARPFRHRDIGVAVAALIAQV